MITTALPMSPPYGVNRGSSASARGVSSVASTNQLLPTSTLHIASVPTHTAAAFSVSADGVKALVACKNVLCLKDLTQTHADITVPRKHLNFDVSIARFNPINCTHFLLAANLGVDLYRVSEHSIELLHCNKNAHNRFINDIDWNYSNRHLFATGSRNEIGFWDVRDGKIAQMKGLPGSLTGVSQLKWCRLEEHVLAAAQGNDVKLWDFRNLNQHLFELTAVQTTSIHILNWSPLENTILVSGNEDFSVKIIDLNSQLSPGDKYTVAPVNTHSDSFTEASKVSKKMNSSASVEPKLIFDKNPVMKAKFTPFARSFTTCDKVENVLRLYSYEDVDQYALQKFESNGGKIVDFEWVSYSHKYQLLSLSSDKSIRIWTPPSDLLESLNVKLQSEDDLVYHETDGPADDPRSNSYKIVTSNIGLVATPMYTEVSPISGSSPTHIATSMGKQIDPSYRGTSTLEKLKSLTIEEEGGGFQQQCDYHSYQSPNNRICLQLECRKGQRSIYVNVQSCLSYSVTFWLKLDSNGEPECVIENQSKNLNQRNKLDLDKVKPFIKDNIRKVFAMEKELLRVDNFAENAQSLGVLIADAVMSAYSLFSKAPVPPKMQELTTIPYPKTSGGRFSAGRLVIFTQSVQQQKQYNFLPTATDKKADPKKHLADYYNSRNASLKFTQISVICQEVPTLFKVDPILARDYKVFSEGVSRSEICEQNRDLCSKLGKVELANVWNVLSSVASMMQQFQEGVPDAFPMSVFPLGRPLVEQYIEFFLKECDIQTVAMIVSVFFEEEDEHLQESDTESSLKLDRRKSKDKSEIDSPEFVLDTPFQSPVVIKKFQKISVTSADFPDQFKREDLTVGEELDDYNMCESPDDKRLMNYKYYTERKLSSASKRRSNIFFDVGDAFIHGDLDEVPDEETISSEHESCKTDLDKDVFCLDPKQQFRYDIFKGMYADILYRWEFFIQRAEVVKTMRTQSVISNKGSELSCPSDTPIPYSDLFKVKFQVLEPSTASEASTTGPRSMLYSSPSFSDYSTPSNQVYEMFKTSKSALSRSSEPIVGKKISLTSVVPALNDDLHERKPRSNQLRSDQVESLARSSQEPPKSQLPKSLPDYYCVVCRREVRGLFSVCLKCGHGGHPGHLRDWFASQGPNGQGHCAYCGPECPCAQLYPFLS